MKRIAVFAFVVLQIATLSGYGAAKEPASPQAIHEKALVFDTHVDSPLAMYYGHVDIGTREPRADLDLLRMVEGGLDAVFFAVFVPNDQDMDHPSERAFTLLDEICNQVGRYGERAEIARNSSDILRLHREGRRAILISMENGGPIEGKLSMLRTYYRLGVRAITLTHVKHNSICDSSTDSPPKWGGLSPFGKEVVTEMNRLGMVVDVSHLSDDAVRDVLHVSRAPVMASHSGARAVCDTPRNLPDDLLRAIAEAGGTVQVNFYAEYIDSDYAKKAKEFRTSMEPVYEELKKTYADDKGAYWQAIGQLWKEKGPDRPGLDRLIDHIDHIVHVAGIDHVGLGSDYDGAGSFPIGLEDVTGYPKITEALLDRGYSPEDVAKILGGNIFRVLREVERTSRTWPKN
ncbi:MAG TPA: dipeptidase [Thermoanaerobaculia bacterium]|nr:dipeptidase [Thermoanaerobaculia bacterium]HUM29814.1 dipeptidase [Thermoanaerobaculia bacterium]HXK68089.1 dipeptidase [Thermoanaerobaculia bacterium]